MNTEILAPAGGVQSARAALLSGADAVYLGLSEFSARSGAENFSVEELAETARFAHLLGAKVYVCLNTLVKDSETDSFFAAARSAWNAGADAILIQDIFLGKVLKETYPEMILHLSTQGGCSNTYGARLAKDYGFSRVVLARETPVREIGRIAEILETETFVQGALCSSYSGQCYFSSFAGGNSGNRGRCKQPCRKRYRIDRAGFEDYAYALSTSDLCAGERVKELLKAGVCSLKIEGRMRRPEYVAAAVKYYRGIVDDIPSDEAFSALKRAYNRGDYTCGLAFGQEKNFLSRNVQGHIGETAGTLSVVRGKFFCKSDVRLNAGDGLKILRGGKEVGGGTVAEPQRDGFFLSSNVRLLEGDEVRVTTDSSSNAEILRPVRTRKLPLKIRIAASELPRAEYGDFVFTGDVPAESAARAPLTKEEIAACFQKTDGLPFAVEAQVETENAFLPKSSLNAFRRAFYAELVNVLAPGRAHLAAREIAAEVRTVRGSRSAEILSDGTGDADIIVRKPRDYARITVPDGGKEKYLFLPPLFTAEQEADISSAIEQFDGIYCDGYYGILLAQKYKKPLFAGTGFNLTNRFAVNGVKNAGAKYFALSAELSAREQNALSASGAFALVGGGIKIMELCYCPFSKSCRSCDKREFYTLTDEDGRKFPLRRYVSGECRFEVYNCASLSVERGEPSALKDETARILLKNAGVTKGHSIRSML